MDKTLPSQAGEATLVLVNRHSGTVRGMGEDVARQMIEEAFAGQDADIRLIEGGDIIDNVQRAMEEGRVRRIVIGGGDGTLASAAGELAGSEIALGILPLGTMNMVAKVIGMAPDLRQALEQLQTAEVRSIDAARAGERLFLHHVSFGMQPRMVKVREKLGYSSRVTKMLAGLRAFAAVMLKPQFHRIALETDGQRTDVKASALIVSNNLYEDSLLLKQARMDEGILGIYAVKPLTFGALARLLFDLVRGRWRDNMNVTDLRGREVKIRKRNVLGRSSHSIKATADGELMLFQLPLTIRSEPAALRMLVPRSTGTP